VTGTSKNTSALIKTLRTGFKRVADPVKAEPMQIYMKSEMPYYGIKAPERRAIQQEVFARYPLESYDEWKDAALALWRGAKYREERYAAMELASDKAYAGYQQLKVLAIYEEMIVTGAWWDFVDAIAIESVGGLLRKYPGSMKPKMMTWSRSKDMWKQRTSILCQIKSREETDLDLLYECIERSIEDKDFFIRKGIGWALREYGKTDPREVLRYVKANRERLHSLSKREAMKPVIKAGLARTIP
jgi:3-methyladenine DNA glycosylase AlkD